MTVDPKVRTTLAQINAMRAMYGRLPEGIQVLPTTIAGEQLLTFSHPDSFATVPIDPEKGAMDADLLDEVWRAAMQLPAVEPFDDEADG